MTEEPIEVSDVMEEEPKQKKNKTLWIILIVVGVLLILCCCAAVIVGVLGLQPGGFLEDMLGYSLPLLGLI
jgi:hypothetical protein